MLRLPGPPLPTGSYFEHVLKDGWREAFHTEDESLNQHVEETDLRKKET